MPEVSLEFNSLLGSRGLVPPSGPAAAVDNERGFRDHLDELQSRPLDDHPANPVSNSTAAFEERRTTSSDADARENDRQKEREENEDKVDDAMMGSGRETAGNINSSRPSNSDTDAQTSAGRQAKMGDEKSLSARPKPEHLKQQQASQAASAEGVGDPSTATEADQARNESAALLDSVEQDSDAKNGTVGTVELRLKFEANEANKHGRLAEASEELKSTDDGVAVGLVQTEVLANANDNTAPPSRRARAAHAKQEIGASTPAIANPIADSGAPTSSPDLAADILAQAQVAVVDDGEQKQDSTPHTESRNETAARNERAVAAPALLSSRQDDLRHASSHGNDLSELDRVRLVQRVARAFHSIGEEGGEMQLRLRPPELGSMRLEIAVRDGVMTAHLETETAAARNVLLDNLPQLRDRLAEQNVKVERFDVNVRDDAQQRNDQAFENQPDLPRSSRRAMRERERTASAANSGPVRSERNEGNGKLNVVI